MSGVVCGKTGKPETGGEFWRLNVQTWDTAGLTSPAFVIGLGKISVVHVDSELFLKIALTISIKWCESVHFIEKGRKGNAHCE